MRNTLSFLVLLVLVTGCASWPPPQQSPADEAPSRPVAQQDAPLVRVVDPAGEGATNALCQLQGGNRYIVEGQPDLAATFECIASVGLAGNPSERPLDGMVEAISPALEGPGGCNEGFLRDDAILVVTFLSDDPNVEDVNTAQTAFDAIVTAKNGNPGAIVMLGLIPDGQSHWVDFISSFGDRGIQGPIASEDYNQFFLDAVAIIEDTCLDFEG